MTATADFRVIAHSYRHYTAIEVITEWMCGFDTYRVWYCDDGGTTWNIVPGSSPTKLPPAGTALVFDFNPPATGTRMYRASTPTYFSPPIEVPAFTETA